MATAVKVKVAPERRDVSKVWNITDWPMTSVKPQLVMVLGVAVAPGKAIEVPNERLKNAHKTEADRKAGLLFVGDSPPQEYLQAMQRRKRLRLPNGAVRGRGSAEEKKPESPKPESPKPELKKSEILVMKAEASKEDPKKSRKKKGQE
jgi:hypothetical protein